MNPVRKNYYYISELQERSTHIKFHILNQHLKYMLIVFIIHYISYLKCLFKVHY